MPVFGFKLRLNYCDILCWPPGSTCSTDRPGKHRNNHLKPDVYFLVNVSNSYHLCFVEMIRNWHSLMWMSVSTVALVKKVLGFFVYKFCQYHSCYWFLWLYYSCLVAVPHQHIVILCYICLSCVRGNLSCWCCGWFYCIIVMSHV